MITIKCTFLLFHFKTGTFSVEDVTPHSLIQHNLRRSLRLCLLAWKKFLHVKLYFFVLDGL